MKYVTLDQIYDIPYCPEDEITCPYYNIDNGRCMMDVMDGCTPYDECDAFDGYEEEEEDGLILKG